MGVILGPSGWDLFVSALGMGSVVVDCPSNRWQRVSGDCYAQPGDQHTRDRPQV